MMTTRRLLAMTALSALVVGVSACSPKDSHDLGPDSECLCFSQCYAHRTEWHGRPERGDAPERFGR